MILIKNQQGSHIKTYPQEFSGELYYHNLYGFVSGDTLRQRQSRREKAGLSGRRGKVLGALHIKNNELVKVYGGEFSKTDSQQWSFSIAEHQFRLELCESPDLKVVPPLEDQEDSKKVQWLPILMILLLFGGAITFLGQQGVLEPEKEEKKMEFIPHEPVAVQIVKPKPKPVRRQALDPKARARKALTQNLGFLKLVGKKNLKDAMGGLPTKSKNASAGAGPGGTQGSGGELLVGLGKGLRKTTVGNSGTKGLGGIGTKGAGGGLGGYGETSIGSGAGRRLSAQANPGEGGQTTGLDRSLIEATISRYLSQVRACYEEGLKHKPGLIGQVTMSFEISGRGGVNYAKVIRSSLRHRDVESCISRRMLTWKFPRPKGNVNVPVGAYPFMLRPMKTL